MRYHRLYKAKQQRHYREMRCRCCFVLLEVTCNEISNNPWYCCIKAYCFQRISVIGIIVCDMCSSHLDIDSFYSMSYLLTIFIEYLNRMPLRSEPCLRV